MVKTAALELGASKTPVNAIAPSRIENRMIRSIASQLSPENPEAVHDRFKTLNAEQRYGTNEGVAQLGLFLASDEASYCSGGIHTIDSGFTAALR